MTADVYDTPQYLFLEGELGGRDVVDAEVNEYIKPFGGLVTFEAGVDLVAAQKGWVNPNKPKPVYMSHLAPEYLETRNWRYNKDGSSAYATVTIAATISSIAPLGCYEYTDADGEDTVEQYVDVTFTDDGFEARVRMKNHPSFTSNAGKDFPANPMCTFWDNFRAAVGKRVKVSGVSVKRSTDFNGNVKYDFYSGSFTRVEKVLEDTVTEEDIDDDGWDDDL